MDLYCLQRDEEAHMARYFALTTFALMLGLGSLAGCLRCFFVRLLLCMIVAVLALLTLMAMVAAGQFDSGHHELPLSPNNVLMIIMILLGVSYSKMIKHWTSSSSSSLTPPKDPLEAIDEAASTTACVVCVERANQVACVPCGHQCLCRQCYRHMQQSGASKCPICVSDIASAIVVFESGRPVATVQ